MAHSSHRAIPFFAATAEKSHAVTRHRSQEGTGHLHAPHALKRKTK